MNIQDLQIDNIWVDRWTDGQTHLMYSIQELEENGAEVGDVGGRGVVSLLGELVSE